MTPEQQAEQIVSNPALNHGGTGQHPISAYCRNCLREAIVEALTRQTTLAHDIIFAIRVELEHSKPSMERIRELLNRWEFAR